MTADEWDVVPDGSGEDTQEQCFRPRYATTERWVSEWLAPLYRRQCTGTRGGEKTQWCDEWWQHAEADDRLTALWWSWEGARRDKNPAAMANWWLLVMDPMWRALTGEDGPFSKCTQGHAETLPGLKVAVPPPGWWTDRSDRSDPEGGLMTDGTWDTP